MQIHVDPDLQPWNRGHTIGWSLGDKRVLWTLKKVCKQTSANLQHLEQSCGSANFLKSGKAIIIVHHISIKKFRLNYIM